MFSKLGYKRNSKHKNRPYNLINSNSITMEGVDFPIIGISDSGEQRLMYPGEEHYFDNSSKVLEIPLRKKQNGGFKKVELNPTGTYSPYGDTMGEIVRNLKKNIPSASSVIKSKQSLNKNTNSTTGYDSHIRNPVTAEDRMLNSYMDAMDKFGDFTGMDTSLYKPDEPFIPLTSGKFNTGKVPKRMVDDLVKSAQNNGLDPFIMLGLAGQESSLGYDNTREGAPIGSQAVISGWNVGQEYEPYNNNRFLSDKNIPTIDMKTSYGDSYSAYDTSYINKYNIEGQYNKKLNSVKLPETFSYFDEAAKWIKNKGIKSYNPGDPRYTSMVEASAEMLRKDKKLRPYVDSLVNANNMASRKRGGFVPLKGYQRAGLFDPENSRQSSIQGADNILPSFQASPNETPAFSPTPVTPGSSGTEYEINNRSGRNFDYGSLSFFLDSALAGIANKVDNNRKKSYEMGNLSNPFNYLPRNNQTNQYEKYGEPSYQDGGEVDNQDDSEDFNSMDEQFLWEDDISPQQDQQEEETPIEQTSENYVEEQPVVQYDDNDFTSTDEENLTNLAPNAPVVSPINPEMPTGREEASSFNPDLDNDFLTYMAHQQGLAGIKAITKAAQTGQSWRDFYNGENLDDNMQNNVSNDFWKQYKELTPANFINYWKSKYEHNKNYYGNIKTPYDDFIAEQAPKYGITPEAVKALIGIESGFDPNAGLGSYRGLTQLSKSEADKNGVTDRTDPYQSIVGALRLMQKNKKSL